MTQNYVCSKMKILFAFFFLATIVLSFAETSVPPRDCIYAIGGCGQKCEQGTHLYSTGCGYKTPEATCDNPDPEPETAMICDYSACYCDEPTVRDTATNKCVCFEECPGATEYCDDD